MVREAVQCVIKTRCCATNVNVQSTLMYSQRYSTVNVNVQPTLQASVNIEPTLQASVNVQPALMQSQR